MKELNDLIGEFISGHGTTPYLKSLARCQILRLIGEKYKIYKDLGAENIITNALTHEKYTVRQAALRILLEQKDTLNPVNKNRLATFLRDKKNAAIITAVSKGFTAI